MASTAIIGLLAFAVGGAVGFHVGAQSGPVPSVQQAGFEPTKAGAAERLARSERRGRISTIALPPSGAGPSTVAGCGATFDDLYNAFKFSDEEAKYLRRKLAYLEELVRGLPPELWMPRSYGLSREEIEEMSAGCEVRWDFAPLDATQATLTSEDFDSAGVPETARPEVKQILAKERDSLIAELREIVAQSFPGATPEQLNEASAFELIEELERDVGLSETIRVHRYFADERAGRMGGAFPSSGLARAYRAFATSGDRLERSIGDRFGQSVAAALRARHGGWPGRYWSRVDACGG